MPAVIISENRPGDEAMYTHTVEKNTADGMHCNCPGSGGLAGIISVTASLLVVKLVQAVWREREELLIGYFGR